ncbi:uncharacterized protein RJT20DRAFT_148191 [Scheffersomyces xylosifermentans]|uniref:uncharacterized protein n=1 Tax=Scheffersomyces xylosifermentans TaxID=1304137 RepID=UPI00315C9FB1
MAETLLPGDKASVSIGEYPPIATTAFITNALMSANFIGTSNSEFKEEYLRPLDLALKDAKDLMMLVRSHYSKPMKINFFSKTDIQNHYHIETSVPLSHIYLSIYETLGIRSSFARSSTVEPFLSTRTLTKLGIVHVLNDNLHNGNKDWDLCVAIGDIKIPNYLMASGFEEMRKNISMFKNMINHDETPCIGSWDVGSSFSFVFRKILLQAFVLGTDRFFVSDHSTFSGFFRYEVFKGGSELDIHYFVINDPETVADGITLRSAIAGFFYKTVEQTRTTREILRGWVKEANLKRELIDPLKNANPRNLDGYNLRLSRNIPGMSGKMIDILPPKVFTKLYYFSKEMVENSGVYTYPNIKKLYHMFFNELAINKKVEKSKFASNYPKLLVSGFWNGYKDHPMHIFEYLGKEVSRKNGKALKFTVRSGRGSRNSI